ncbi:MAG: hypothetical protein KJ063_02205 [Anaerolineae bacterium]|nr:hypothetical protein [Anaerolineae bacterium]
MALTNRKDVRLEVSALFEGITAIAVNLPYPPLSLDGVSPLVYLHDDGVAPEMLAAASNQFDFYFVLTLCINRQAYGEAAAEDALDEVWTAVMQAIRDNVTGVTYTALEVEGRTRPFFALVDGVHYRFEELSLMARGNISG